MLSSALSPSGEIGIVERSTGEAGFTFSSVGADIVAAAMIVYVAGVLRVKLEMIIRVAQLRREIGR